MLLHNFLCFVLLFKNVATRKILNHMFLLDSTSIILSYFTELSNCERIAIPKVNKNEIMVIVTVNTRNK